MDMSHGFPKWHKVEKSVSHGSSTRQGQCVLGAQGGEGGGWHHARCEGQSDGEEAVVGHPKIIRQNSKS